ncbi:MAG: hypothetical protein K1X44_02225 [Alphaproteobacteria bacterium]|nr:hypothetical protein [Alphaproteobacteria bacterium]
MFYMNKIFFRLTILILIILLSACRSSTPPQPKPGDYPGTSAPWPSLNSSHQPIASISDSYDNDIKERSSIKETQSKEIED